MKVMRRSRWLARLAAMLVVGVAGLVVAASAPARPGRDRVPVPRRGELGFNNEGDLGDGTTTDRSLYGDIKLANDVDAAGHGADWAPVPAGVPGRHDPDVDGPQR